MSQRGRKRRSSDGSDEGHHSDGDYSEHDYRGDPADEKESKTIMLRGLPMNTLEADVRCCCLPHPKAASYKVSTVLENLNISGSFLKLHGKFLL